MLSPNGLSLSSGLTITPTYNPYNKECLDRRPWMDVDTPQSLGCFNATEQRQNRKPEKINQTMSEQREKFEQLLRELFQFDCADLDFGIYRIMNHKRDVIEKFIQEDLLNTVSGKLEEDILKERKRIAEELQTVREKIVEILGSQALDGDDKLAGQYHDTPLGKRYLSLQERASHDWDRESMERNIFNRLHDFFSRYYQDGDFISKRRYSKNQRYAIPYNGEEVHLHWANSDQYYIKTAEHFQDYRFKADNISVHFQLQTAYVEQNNVKGEKRFFMALTKEMVWDEKDCQLRIPFEYRPQTAQGKAQRPAPPPPPHPKTSLRRQ